MTFQLGSLKPSWRGREQLPRGSRGALIPGTPSEDQENAQQILFQQIFTACVTWGPWEAVWGSVPACYGQTHTSKGESLTQAAPHPTHVSMLIIILRWVQRLQRALIYQIPGDPHRILRRQFGVGSPLAQRRTRRPRGESRVSGENIWGQS